jgi:hypothetical protein
MTRAIKAGSVALLGATLLIAFAFPGWGQSRGGARRIGGMSRAPMVRVVPRTARPQIVPRVTRPLNSNFASLNGVRGLGFGYTRPAAIRMTRDRFGRLHRVRVFFGAGYPGYYPYDYGYDEVPYDDTTQQSVLQQPTYVEQPAPAPSEDAVSAPEAPVPDVGQFVLVRKDGQVVLAAAFTISGDRLTYITPDGARHSFLVAELNKENTRQMNDSNGTTVTLPD